MRLHLTQNFISPSLTHTNGTSVHCHCLKVTTACTVATTGEVTCGGLLESGQNLKSQGTQQLLGKFLSSPLLSCEATFALAAEKSHFSCLGVTSNRPLSPSLHLHCLCSVTLPLLVLPCLAAGHSSHSPLHVHHGSWSECDKSVSCTIPFESMNQTDFKLVGWLSHQGRAEEQQALSPNITVNSTE